MRVIVSFILSFTVIGAMRCAPGFNLVKEDEVYLCLKVIKDKEIVCTHEAKTGECLEIGNRVTYRKDYQEPIVFGDSSRTITFKKPVCRQVERDVKTKYYPADGEKEAQIFCDLKAKNEQADLIKKYYVSGKVSCLLKKSFEQCL